MKTLKKFEFKEFGTRGNGPSYPWEKLLDGGIYQLEEGTDYQCKPLTFQSLLRGQARKAGKVVRIGKNETGMVIQAQAASDEQKASWAEADEAKAAAKAAGKNGDGAEDDSDDDTDAS